MAKSNWQRIYLAELCLLEAMNCSRDFSKDEILNVLKEKVEVVYGTQFNDGRSGLTIKKVALTHFIERSLHEAQKKEDLSNAWKALREYEYISSTSEQAELRRKIENKIREIDEVQKKLVAGVRR